MAHEQKKLLLTGLMAGPRWPSYDNWFEMADRYGFETNILGRDEAKFVPFYTKWKCILDYVRSLPEDEIVFYLDPLDAFVCDSPENILAKYRSYDTPLVIGAEDGPYPTHDFDVPDPFWRWGNTGMMIGRAGTIREAYEGGYELEDWEAFGHVSDQHALIKYVLLPENVGMCTVDYRRTIVSNNWVGAKNANLEDQYERHRHRLQAGHDSDPECASAMHFYARHISGYDWFADLYGLKPFS